MSNNLVQLAVIAVHMALQITLLWLKEVKNAKQEQKVQIPSHTGKENDGTGDSQGEVNHKKQTK